MKNKFLIRCTALCMATLMALAPINVSAATLLKKGSKGNDVVMVQTSLKELGYYTYSKTTGYYGSITVKAVKRFQRDNNIVPDGIIGKKTKSLLTSATASKTAPKVSAKRKSSDLASPKLKAVSGSAIMLSTVEPIPENSGDLDWFKEVRNIWGKGEVALVTDVDTGKSFEVKRTYGTNHADVEPMTTRDTKIIKEIWGGFSWERRAVIVHIGKYTIAASMTAMPHAGLDSAPNGKFVRNRSEGYGSGINLDAVKNNGCSGVMDIHFKNSKTHTTNRVQKSQQSMVEKAAGYISGLIRKS